MGRIKPRGRYMAISVPIALHDEISKHVLASNYNSTADFVKSAVREKMQRDHSEEMDIFYNLYNKLSDEELVKEIKNHKDFREFSLDELKEGVAFVRESDNKWFKEIHNLDKLKRGIEHIREVRQKKKKELPQEKKEPVLQLSESELTNMIESVVTRILDKKEKKLE